jgi:hypothetical protein
VSAMKLLNDLKFALFAFRMYRSCGRAGCIHGTFKAHTAGEAKILIATGEREIPWVNETAIQALADSLAVRQQKAWAVVIKTETEAND